MTYAFIALDNGNLTVQPTNHLLFTEKSFTDDSGWPKGLKRQTEVYNCE